MRLEGNRGYNLPALSGSIRDANTGERVLGQARDQWAEWLLHRRHGGDSEEIQRTIDRLAKVRDRVLDNADIAKGETLLDVGTGDGLIAFGALERVGKNGTVIFSDISQDLLDHDRQLATQLGVLDQCRFILASADDLSPVSNESVDIVTTRSVLAYVRDKREAFSEFARVLRPNGRISLYEPINRLIQDPQANDFFGYDVTPVRDLALRVERAYEQRQSLDADPMFDYDERDLLTFAEAADFGERHLELHVDCTRQTPRHWETFAHSSPNPRAPTPSEAIAETLTPAEAAEFEAHLRPLVERGEGISKIAVAYLWGVTS